MNAGFKYTKQTAKKKENKTSDVSGVKMIATNKKTKENK